MGEINHWDCGKYTLMLVPSDLGCHHMSSYCHPFSMVLLPCQCSKKNEGSPPSTEISETLSQSKGLLFLHCFSHQSHYCNDKLTSNGGDKPGKSESSPLGLSQEGRSVGCCSQMSLFFRDFTASQLCS